MEKRVKNIFKGAFRLVCCLCVVTLLGCLGSCSKQQSADAGDLLQTVPADASLVGVVNLNSMLDKTGSKVDGSKVELSDVMKSAIGTLDSKTQGQLNALFNGDSGIEFSVCAFFVQGLYNYLTGLVADPAKFKAYVERETNQKFAESDGVDACAYVGLKGNQFWFNAGNLIDPKQVKHFSSLSESQSFLSKSVSKDLVTVDHDMEAWGNISGLMNASGLGFQQTAVTQMALQTLYEDPADILATMNFDEGEATLSFSVLNSKGKTAKFVLPSQKVDVKAVENIGGKTDMLVALAIPHKLIEDLKKNTQSKGASVLGMVMEYLDCLDGTAAAAIDMKGNAVKGIIQTNGKDVSPLRNLLSSELQLTVRVDGKTLEVSRGEVNGSAGVQELASCFKDAIGGVVYSQSESTKSNTAMDCVAGGSLVLVSENGGVGIKVTAKSNDPKENFLVTLLKNAK